jgi:hypothetical protein
LIKDMEKTTWSDHKMAKRLRLSGQSKQNSNMSFLQKRRTTNYNKSGDAEIKSKCAWSYLWLQTPMVKSC